MTTHKRKPLSICFSLVLLGVSAIASAQSYPNRAIRFVVPVVPGGGPDVVARILTPKLTKILGHQIVVDNRAGANALIGADVVAKAPADGYTWLFATGQNTANHSLVKKMPHDIVKDFAAVVLVVKTPYFLVVHPSIPAKSVPELIALAKARPGKLNFGSGGVGSAAHLSGELLKTMAKIQMVHVPYKGMGLALSDLVGGHIDLMFPAILSGIPQYKAGRLRGLGVTSPRRHPSLPEIPTIAEAAVPGFETQSWFGILVPAGTPPEIINKINAAFQQTVNRPEIKEALINQGSNPETNSPAEFSQFIKDELIRAARVFKAAGVNPE